VQEWSLDVFGDGSIPSDCTDCASVVGTGDIYRLRWGGLWRGSAADLRLVSETRTFGIYQGYDFDDIGIRCAMDE
jgi:hypothetical protein